MRAIDLAQGEGPIDDNAFAEALRAIESIAPSVHMKTTEAAEASFMQPVFDLGIPESLPTSCPPRPS